MRPRRSCASRASIGCSKRASRVINRQNQTRPAHAPASVFLLRESNAVHSRVQLARSVPATQQYRKVGRVDHAVENRNIDHQRWKFECG
jgi:hypothetical protein